MIETCGICMDQNIRCDGPEEGEKLQFVRTAFLEVAGQTIEKRVYCPIRLCRAYMSYGIAQRGDFPMGTFLYFQKKEIDSIKGINNLIKPEF